MKSLEVCLQADQDLKQFSLQQLKVQSGKVLTIMTAESQLRDYLSLVDQVITQTGPDL